jgi:hypothetical protein
MDFSGFVSGLIGNAMGGLIAGALLLWLAYHLVERRLRLEDMQQRRAEEFARREETRTSILRVIHGELEAAAGYVQVWLHELPTEAVPYPGFEINGWALVSQVTAFTTLRADTIQALSHAYNRMRTANDQLSFLADLNHGATALIVNHVAAAGIEEDLVKEAFTKFLDQRDRVRRGLIERCEDLKTWIDTAIDRVEDELRLELPHRAAQREYSPEAWPTDIE